MESIHINSNALSRILNQNNKKVIFHSKLIKIYLKDCNSNIIKSNNNILYAAKYEGLAGLFSKEVDDTKAFGRVMCDLAKLIFNSHGFFTSDELPRYGINRVESKEIFKITDKGLTDLIILFAYDRYTSNQMNKFVSKQLQNILDSLVDSQHPVEHYEIQLDSILKSSLAS